MNNIKWTLFKIDIFAAGCLLYYGFTNGQHPFGKNRHLRQANIISHKAPDLSHLVGDRARFRPLIRDMISFDYKSRPSANLVLQRFHRYLSDTLGTLFITLILSICISPNLHFT